jgi:predicted transcriptional regulator
MSDFNEVTWDQAMRRGHAALVASESLYEEINEEAGRSNIDIEKHLRRSEVRAAHAQAWMAMARELATEGNRYGQAGT